MSVSQLVSKRSQCQQLCILMCQFPAAMQASKHELQYYLNSNIPMWLRSMNYWACKIWQCRQVVYSMPT
jgi:hypothetical protein